MAFFLICVLGRISFLNLCALMRSGFTDLPKMSL